MTTFACGFELNLNNSIEKLHLSPLPRKRRTSGPICFGIIDIVL